MPHPQDEGDRAPPMAAYGVGAVPRTWWSQVVEFSGGNRTDARQRSAPGRRGSRCRPLRCCPGQGHPDRPYRGHGMGARLGPGRRRVRHGDGCHAGRRRAARRGRRHHGHRRDLHRGRRPRPPRPAAHGRSGQPVRGTAGPADDRPAPAPTATETAAPQPGAGGVVAPVPGAQLRQTEFTTDAPDVRAAAAIRTALAQIGLPYIWGGNGPTNGDAGFDCSGLTTFSYASAGVSLPRTAHTQYNAGPHVPDGAPCSPATSCSTGRRRMCTTSACTSVPAAWSTPRRSASRCRSPSTATRATTTSAPPARPRRPVR